MIQLYKNLKDNINSINNLLGEYGQIQKIYSSAYSISLSIRAKRETHYLYLGRGELFQGIILKKIGIPSEMRQRDKFLEYLRAKLIGRSFLGLELDSKDRAFSLNYMQGGKINNLLFFYAGKSFYFANFFYDLDLEKFIIFKSWDQKKEEKESYLQDKFSLFDEVGRKDLLDKEKRSEEDDPLQKELLLLKKKDTKKIKFLKNKIKNIKNDLEMILSSHDLSSVVNDFSYLEKLGKKEKILGISFNFKGENVYQRRDEIFKKIKSLKLAETIQKERLEKAEKELNALKLHFHELPKIFSPVWNTKNKKEIKIIKKEGDFHLYRFQFGILVIGLSAQGNDQIRKRYSKKEDIWFHLEDETGPHIIVSGAKIIDQELLSIVAGVMKTYTKKEVIKLDLIFTSVKNLKGVRGSPGKVIYKKEKHQGVVINENWKNLITHSSQS